MVCNPLRANLAQSPQSRPGHCSRTQAWLGEHNPLYIDTHTKYSPAALLSLLLKIRNSFSFIYFILINNLPAKTYPFVLTINQLANTLLYYSYFNGNTRMPIMSELWTVEQCVFNC